MKKRLSTATLILLISISFPTLSTANAKQGQRIYKKKLQKKCGFSAVRFARNHTQAEWEDIYNSGNFTAEAQKICPEIDIMKIKEKWWKELYAFSFKYAKDGIEPNGCND
ncbi:hypothetical protein ACM66Z_06700 [Sulfurovum sp. ST-21]|uniref:Cytochrome C n=1 Tax=Sulfurovum indicum TaxID=2779528 RepID=A0A7M1S245_9BACT|nr:hypothetical protein [Sulfurovum indicum]QOR61142.1 hypothetical protein IMZ28_06655 [Sulfurovum indicum]